MLCSSTDPGKVPRSLTMTGHARGVVSPDLAEPTARTRTAMDRKQHASVTNRSIKLARSGAYSPCAMDQLPGWQCAGASEDRAPELCFLGDGICPARLKAFMALDYDLLDLALRSRPLEPYAHSGGAIVDRLSLGSWRNRNAPLSYRRGSKFRYPRDV
jgi:hypothetical protein